MPPTKTPKAYSYIRFSTPEQQHGDSFRRQSELSQKYAQAHGLTLDEKLTYRDLGVSAFDKSNVRNGELGAFLRAVDSGAVEPGSYLLVPDRVELVQRMFQWSKDGIGSETIARRLNQEGLQTWGTRSADRWHASYIKKILDNRAVLGEFQPHTLVNGKRVPEGDPAPDYFPRIISDEDFVLAMTARQSRRTNSAGRKGQTFSNLFSGILRCGYCNGSMVYVNKGHGGPRAKLLVCARAKAGKGCHYVPWEYPQFERSVLTYCKGLDFDTFLQTRDTVKSELAALSARIAVLESSITDNEQRQAHLLEAIESGGAKFQQFEARMVELEQNRMKFNAELDETRQKYDLRANAKVDVTAVRTSIDGLLQRISELEGDELYDMRARLSQHIKRLIVRIAMYPGGYIEQPFFVEKLKAHLVSKGTDASAADEYIASRLRLTPNVNERFFTMVSRSDAIRTIRPDIENPELLHLEVPEGAEARIFQVATIGAMMEKLNELTQSASR